MLCIWKWNVVPHILRNHENIRDFGGASREKLRTREARTYYKHTEAQFAQYRLP